MFREAIVVFDKQRSYSDHAAQQHSLGWAMPSAILRCFTGRRVAFLISLMGLLTGFLVGQPAQAAPEVIRLAFIDPLSGPFANAGESSFRHFRAAVETLPERVAQKNYTF